MRDREREIEKWGKERCRAGECMEWKGRKNGD